ncbi:MULTISPECIES: hypothetical protein [Methanobacterium]|jgi:Mn2+/Fe2+ NRAMP family transporter|uniref:Putative membrane protein n=1 Tax=Methanobacterium formicicum TaxID=2162 RepID=A0A090JX18_METFO|nr:MULTISPECIES: hypothetical protein [Methanobacterium]KUK75584.1 MAG: Uncharacterized protein XD90_0151 [Methanobacterium sp. 42_16]MBF4476054.1 hypothetical protein [Methanobacterium formicicum]MDH2659165.1 hypothetical protein [Methanobacterium formicicum]CEA14046.1 putative membrane protein [Methanobacterium formicicum]
MSHLLLPWILTVFIEFAIIWLFIRKEPGKLLVYSLLINSLTLPLATYSYIYLYPNLLLIEALVIMVELVFLKFLLETTYTQALAMSLTANVGTFLVGCFLLN